MTETSYPFDAGAGAAINEAQWQQMARRFRQTGVIDGSLNKLLVSADGSALSVSVATGDAFVEGFFYRNDAALAKTIATAHATNPRIDTVVVRLDRVANTATLQVITGTPAASPVAPALSQTDSLYELPLANVLVPAAAGVIVAGNVTDRRTLTQTFDSAAYAPKAAISGKAKPSANQSLATGTTTVVTIDTSLHDTGGIVDIATDRLVCDRAGQWEAVFQLEFASNATGRRIGAVRRNGTQVSAFIGAPSPTVGATAFQVATGPVVCAVGDYFDFTAHQDSGGALNTTAAGTYMTLKFIGS